ncbi:MAG: hypothetical protein LRY66_04095 [Saccharospirillaceae bacterium]|nr:hypothetical protein [Saccharospirillaceae bacterium]MCD8530539.1 hypothetical protein [Saccharospirillaceae bacterium]
MDNSGKPSPPAFDIESFFNSLIQRLFPVWYATQAAKEISLAPLGTINPTSFLSHRWLSLQAVVQSLRESLQSAGKDWQPLIDLMEKLLIEKEYKRPLSITAIDGVEFSHHEQDWPNLYSYAENNCADIILENADDFDQTLRTVFPNESKPHRVIYREWDGRYYWINKEEPRLFAALLMYAQQKQRDASVQALISVESLNNKVLDRLRNDYWLLLMQRDSAYVMHDLLSRADLPAVLAEFEWRRSDLVFLVARKNNRKINRILLNLLNNRSTQQITEFGRFLTRQHFPFRNH